MSRNENFGKFQAKIQCGGISVYPREIIFADDNAVIVLSEAELLELMPIVEVIHKKEMTLLHKIKAGENICNIFDWVVWKQ